MKDKVLVFGESGLVGSGFSQVNKDRFEIIAPTLDEVDILNMNQLSAAVKESGAETVINLVGFTAVDKAEDEVGNKDGLVYKLNVTAAENVACLCEREGKHLIHISTAFVFDGKKENHPYDEEDLPNPLNWYGKTKYLGEQAVIDSGCHYTIVRIDMPYCASYPLKSDFFRFFLEKLKAGEKVTAITDQKITPIFIPDLARALRFLVEEQKTGIFHLASADITTPFEFAKAVADKFGFDSSLVEAVTFEKISQGRKAARPKNSWMDSSKFSQMVDLKTLHTTEEALDLLKDELA